MTKCQTRVQSLDALRTKMGKKLTRQFWSKCYVYCEVFIVILFLSFCPKNKSCLLWSFHCDCISFYPPSVPSLHRPQRTFWIRQDLRRHKQTNLTRQTIFFLNHILCIKKIAQINAKEEYERNRELRRERRSKINKEGQMGGLDFGWQNLEHTHIHIHIHVTQLCVQQARICPHFSACGVHAATAGGCTRCAGHTQVAEPQTEQSLYSNKYAKRLWLQSVIVYNADLSPNWFVNMISKKQWSCRCLALWWRYNYTIVIQTYGKHPAVGDWAVNVGYRFFVSPAESLRYHGGTVRGGVAYRRGFKIHINCSA